jgi:hypothetical protein
MAWWNPKGSITFRLLCCRVTGAAGTDGAAVDSDPALNLIDAQSGRTAAKLIDLDPSSVPSFNTPRASAACGFP